MKKKLHCLRMFDIYGQPVSIQYNSRNSHLTLLGGLLTIAFAAALGYWTYLRVSWFLDGSRDEYRQVKTVKPFDELGSFPLNTHSDRSMSFEVYVDDPDFDNETNQYGIIKLLKYVSKKDQDQPQAESNFGIVAHSVEYVDENGNVIEEEI